MAMHCQVMKYRCLCVSGQGGLDVQQPPRKTCTIYLEIPDEYLLNACFFLLTFKVHDHVR